MNAIFSIIPLKVTAMEDIAYKNNAHYEYLGSPVNMETQNVPCVSHTWLFRLKLWVHMSHVLILIL